MNTIIVANGNIRAGEALKQTVATAHEHGAYVIAADGGAGHALALALQPDLVVGDLDSIAAPALQQLEAQGVRIERFPSEKDETDLELALLEAVARGATQVRIIGAIGDRLDQSLAAIYLLSLSQLRATDVQLIDGDQSTWLIQPGHHAIPGEVGDTVSLIPFNGDAGGITTTGLQYPLRNEMLSTGPARGISNVIVAEEAAVDLASGQLLVIHTIGQAK
ncbi:MAG: thiamine diphosphokinase [Chloroflexi bacterium]|nr:thiamine diphosphokinase [Chloroflexota bacterium]